MKKKTQRKKMKKQHTRKKTTDKRKQPNKGDCLQYTLEILRFFSTQNKDIITVVQCTNLPRKRNKTEIVT